MAWWQQYTGFLRGFRPFYRVYNWQQRKSLQYNESLYRHYGLLQSVFSPVSAKNFESMESHDVPWLDRSGSSMEEALKKTKFSIEIKEQLAKWPEQGYLVCRGFIPSEKIDKANEELDALLREGRSGFNYTGKKIMQAWKWSPAMKEIFTDGSLLEILGYILGKQIIPFHTINFHYGSEQKAHSDAIHMATFPRGYLVAAWVAMEDIDEENGPLFYYPGSHKLPYPENKLIGSHNNILWLDQQANDKYEEYLAGLLEQSGLNRETFFARKGDVLIWHANLVHGGSPHLNEYLTRRSAAMHYFAEGVIPYHEISERPAIFEDEMISRKSDI